MIEALHVSKKFYSGTKGIQVLSDISFALEKGKMLTIMGKSGSGKSTLLNCLGGLEVPDRGDINCFGININLLSAKQRALFQRKQLGFVFQTNNLLSYLSVGENIAFPLVLNNWGKKEREKRTAQLLEMLELDLPAASMPHELSGGQAQRVAFARAVAHSPQMLLADEPTASLDTQTGLNLIRLMHRVGMENSTTMIVATHDNELMKYADKTLYINDGEFRGE